MKHTKYLVLEEEDFKHSCIPLSSTPNTLEEAKLLKIQYEIGEVQSRERLSVLDITVEPAKFHIYKLEQVD